MRSFELELVKLWNQEITHTRYIYIYIYIYIYFLNILYVVDVLVTASQFTQRHAQENFWIHIFIRKMCKNNAYCSHTGSRDKEKYCQRQRENMHRKIEAIFIKGGNHWRKMYEKCTGRYSRYYHSESIFPIIINIFLRILFTYLYTKVFLYMWSFYNSHVSVKVDNENYIFIFISDGDK